MRANSCLSEHNDPDGLYARHLNNYVIMEADTDELRDICFRLRYQVYCIENAFEDPNENTGALETDAYDPYSVHGLVIHRPTGMAAGTVRLILPGADREPPLPFLSVYEPPNTVSPAIFPTSMTAEISRFAISKKFRLATRGELIRSSRAGANAGTRAPIQREADIVILALIQAFVGLAARNDVQFFCAMMERALLRRVARLGIHFNRVGPDVEYHGARQPSVIGVSTMLERVRAERPDVWDVITNNGAYAPAFSKLIAAE